MAKKGKLPPPGSKKEKNTCFYTRKKWKSVLQNSLVDLAGRQIDPRGAMVISFALQRNHYVSRVDLTQNNLGDEGALAIVELLRVNTTIQLLNLSQNNITDIGGIALASAFIPTVSPSGAPGQWNRTLFTIILAGNEIGDDSLLAFSNAAVCNRDLTKIDFSWNHVGPQGTNCLWRCFQRNPLVHFSLMANNIEDMGTIHLCDAMQRFGGRSQTTLNLYRNNITHRGAEAIGKLLEHNNIILEVNLTGNTIGHKGMQALKQSLVTGEEDCSLRSLNLSNNLLGDDGAIQLAELIAANGSSLISIDCSNNGITDKGATAIVKALQSNSNLQMIDCQGNLFGPKAVAAVEELVRTTKTLKSLNISNCIESKETRRQLMMIVGDHDGVHIDVGNTGEGGGGNSSGTGGEDTDGGDKVDVPVKIAEYLQLLAEKEAQRLLELKKAGKLNKKKSKKK